MTDDEDNLLPKFQPGDVVQFIKNGAWYEVKCNKFKYYTLRFLSWGTHRGCALPTEGRAVEYVDANFRKQTKLEKVLK